MNKEQLEQLSDGELSNAIIQTDVGKMDHSFDINDANCMMPLVFGSGISLTDPDSSGEKVWIASKWFASLRPSIQSRSSNPLRAASIVYLLIKEGE
jgi:fructose-specific component phosphotransferase system IIB-like protein